MQVKKGRLDGLVVLRFTLAYKTGGGIEEHTRNINQLLLQRNRMKIVQIFLDSKGSEHSITEELIGKGKLIWVPIQAYKITEMGKSNEISALLKLWPWEIKGKFGRLVSKTVNATIGITHLREKMSLRFFTQEPGKLVKSLLEKYKVDLAVLHSIGSLDDVEIISALDKLEVPFAFIHHFENSRLAHPLMRQILKKAAAIGGVSKVDVPRYLRRRFIHVREGVDTDFYDVERASPLNICDKECSIFLPARIARSKGQLDLIEAMRLLNRNGIKAKLVLAGRIDSDDVKRELTSAVSLLDDPKQVLLLGELDQDAVRDWYAACKIVALPSYSEGLGRVLLEAQSMKRPVIAYAVGGVPEAIRHGETGYLVNKGDIPGLASKLRELLLNESKSIQMGESGRRFIVNEFSVQRLVDSHEALYLSILKGGSAYLQ